MSDVIISPNMNLPVPVVSSEPGPDWANDLNACMTAIDQHDHTSGNGVPITPSGMDINSDLSMNDYALDDVGSVIFTAQSGFSTQKAVYVDGVDLYYNDGSGNIIRITQSGAVSGASGTITGLPSGTASASYQSVAGTFQFQSATNTPANGDFASVFIAQKTANPKKIQLKSPNSLAADYSVTFPTAVPAASSFVMMASTGALSTRAISGPTSQRFTSSTGTYTTPAGVYYIKIRMIGGGGGGGAADTNSGSAGANTTWASTLLVAGGGGGGLHGFSLYGGGAGGTNSSTAGPTILVSSQGGGGGGLCFAGNTSGTSGGVGGSSVLGGGANSPTANAAGNAASANSGGGGSGGADNTVQAGGGGGGAGGYIEAIIQEPASTYAYAIGAGGAAGAAGTKAGGAGGSGLIIVEEYYQ